MNPDSPRHPGDDALRALSAGRLPEPQLGEVALHLGDCPECCRRIDQLGSDDPLLARLREGAAGRDSAAGPAERRAVRAFRQLAAGGSATPVIGLTAVALPRPVPRRVGDYDILGEVGRGGMGVVYEARHRGLNRPAALKMTLAGEFASPDQEARFRLEAELAARVRHPDIVQV